MKLADKKMGIKTIERLLGVKAVYSGPPTFCYKIGAFMIDRDGNVTCQNDEELIKLEKSLADEGVAGEGIPHLSSGIGVSAPESIRNLINMIHSKQYLIGRAVGYKAFDVSGELVAVIRDKDLTVEEMLLRIRTYAPAGIEVIDDKVIITGLPDTESYKRLAEAMITASNIAKWVSPDETIEQNEKFYMRAWLVRIGLDGPDTKAVRSTILKNLKGHTAFRNEEAAARWRERH